MAITFYLSGPLRVFAGERDHVEVRASPATVSDALQALWATYPGLRDRVTTEQGEIRQHVSIFVGREDIRYTGGLATPITDGAEISIFPALSGGDSIA
jgi:molybdopterin synthase sulfur carrier subunit